MGTERYSCAVWPPPAPSLEFSSQGNLQVFPFVVSKTPFAFEAAKEGYTK